jgi:hypothetical protein
MAGTRSALSVGERDDSLFRSGQDPSSGVASAEGMAREIVMAGIQSVLSVMASAVSSANCPL